MTNEEQILIRLILDRHFLGHYCFILNLTDPCPRVDKRRRNIRCSLHDHALAQEPLPWGSWNLQFLVSLPYRWYIPNFANWPSSSREEDVNGLRTTNGDWRQPIAICHLTDSSDLKRVWPFIWKNLKSLHLRILLKLSFNQGCFVPSGSEDGDINVKSLQTNGQTENRQSESSLELSAQVS